MVLLKLLVVAVFSGVHGQVQYPIIRDGCYNQSESESVCWEVNPMDYPAEAIIMKLAAVGEETFGEFNNPSDEDDSSLKNPSEFCGMCKTEISFRITPKLLVKDNKECYVVASKNYNQSIVYQICDREQAESTCTKKRENLPNDVTTECQQKKTILKLLCYEPKSNELVGWDLHYDSSCVCVLKRTD